MAVCITRDAFIEALEFSLGVKVLLATQEIEVLGWEATCKIHIWRRDFYSYHDAKLLFISPRQ